jgi:hypothetical protein
MRNRFLYLKIFLAVTFAKKFSLFQINGMRSKIILLPERGAFGRIKSAGEETISL